MVLTDVSGPAIGGVAGDACVQDHAILFAVPSWIDATQDAKARGRIDRVSDFMDASGEPVGQWEGIGTREAAGETKP